MTPQPRRREPGELVFGYLMLGISLFLFYQSYTIAKFSSLSSAGAFPLLATGIMVVTAVVIIVQSHRMPGSTEPGESLLNKFIANVTPLHLVVMVGMTILYTALIEPIGFLAASFLYLVATMLYLYERKIPLVLGIAVVTLVSMYVIFQLAFTVVLPKGWLFQ